MSSLAVKSFVFDCPSSSASSMGGDALKITANRYTLEDSAENMEGVTLLFTHCIGSHKEQWEPTISRLFRQQKHKCPAHQIREAWSFDWQSHGDAAVLNREAIRSRSEDCISAYEWASAIAAFLRSPYMKDHRVVGLGHSAGAAAVLISTNEFAINDSPYVCVVLIEPTMASRDSFYSRYEEHKAAVEFAVNTTSGRRDTWNSKDDAFAYFMKRVPWKNWDPRVVRLLVEHGLQATGGAVQLKCDKRQEALSYGDTEPHFEGANLISRLCHSLPIHLVFGARDDPVPDFIKHSLCDTSQGRFVASIRRVKHAGHMVVQEQPDRLADSICGILDGIPTYRSIRSRL
ncbi:hypothetical protein M378DRAFT_182764 [Amanita muscaria Koide BX008]|uniref:AB hydrolase-1 domain-containing protein n=1 Tax=Amanita muscaria (strain Koide BX008) TaxID=946122 RepID=A0A0C2TV02_AMAMK|nr:hypothetical protein M378DRAFT_182764 [Amanita muscaria Koide BX008]